MVSRYRVSLLPHLLVTDTEVKITSTGARTDPQAHKRTPPSHAAGSPGCRGCSVDAAIVDELIASKPELETDPQRYV